jgi:micrococcal nuclease
MLKNDYIYNAKITNIVDGDTVDVSIDLGFYVFINERIRLNGIDTPELNSSDPIKREAAKAAKAFLLPFVGSDISIVSYKKDKYGRFLGDIYLKGNTVSINTTLINEGHAVPYSGGARIP